MRKLLLLTCIAAALAAPAAAAGSDAPSLPPTDPVHIEGGNSGCQPDYPCSPQPISVEVDKTYPSRVVAWVKSLP